MCVGVSNVRVKAHAQNEIHECAKGVLEVLNVDLKRGEPDKMLVLNGEGADRANVSFSQNAPGLYLFFFFGTMYFYVLITTL